MPALEPILHGSYPVYPSQDSYHSEPLPLRGTRILVVEDSWQIGEAMAGLLKELGAEVSGPVATSTDALRLASEQPPDAALIDFDLRDGERADGLIELLHVLGIHVVVATGSFRPSAVIALLSCTNR